MVLGIGSLVMALCSCCCLIFTIIGLIMGIVAIVMGRIDLKKIDGGTMDPGGRSTTYAGWICGIVGTVLNGLSLLINILLVLFGVGMNLLSLNANQF